METSKSNLQSHSRTSSTATAAPAQSSEPKTPPYAYVHTHNSTQASSPPKNLQQRRVGQLLSSDSKFQEQIDKALDFAITFLKERDYIQAFCAFNTLILLGAEGLFLEAVRQHAIDINAKDKYGHVFLHHAASEGNAKAVAALLALKADVHIADREGWTALHYGVMSGNSDVVTLCQTKATINVKTSQSLTGLHLASAYGHINILKSLLATNANIHAPTESANLTPLHLAAMKGHLEIVKELLKAGADPEAKDSSSKTPIHYAEKYHPTTIAPLLRSASAPNKGQN